MCLYGVCSVNQIPLKPRGLKKKMSHVRPSAGPSFIKFYCSNLSKLYAYSLNLELLNHGVGGGWFQQVEIRSWEYNPFSPCPILQPKWPQSPHITYAHLKMDTFIQILWVLEKKKQSNFFQILYISQSDLFALIRKEGFVWLVAKHGTHTHMQRNSNPRSCRISFIWPIIVQPPNLAFICISHSKERERYKCIVLLHMHSMHLNPHIVGARMMYALIFTCEIFSSLLDKKINHVITRLLCSPKGGGGTCDKMKTP